MSNKYYQIENGKIVNIIVVKELTSDLTDSLTLVPYNEVIDYNFEEYEYDYQLKELVYKPVNLDELKDRKKSELASIRWHNEHKGTTYNGLSILTDIITQTKILGAVVAASLDPNYTVKWKTTNGFVELDSVQIINLAQIIRQHIQSCFDNEARIIELIDNCLNKEEIDNIDLNIGWP